MSLSELSKNHGQNQENGESYDESGKFRSLTSKTMYEKSLLKLGQCQEATLADREPFRCPFCPLRIFEHASGLIHHVSYK